MRKQQPSSHRATTSLGQLPASAGVSWILGTGSQPSVQHSNHIMVITSSKTMMTIAEASTLTSFATATLKPVPYSQRQLLLHDPRQPYKLHTDKEIPELRFGDLLVEVYGIGLNQIDWNTTCVRSMCGLHLPRRVIARCSAARYLTNIMSWTSEILDLSSHHYLVSMGASLSAGL